MTPPQAGTHADPHPEEESPTALSRRRSLLRTAMARVFERGMKRIAETPLTTGNTARLLVDGTRAYPVMLEAIASARRRIHFENYIIRDDAVGREFAAALSERARAGIEVRVLYDWFGSVGTGRAYWDELREAGCEVRSFGSPVGRRPLTPLARDHRKLLVVDGRRSVMGGLCIGQEWREGEDGDGCWRDTGVLLEGPVARELDLSFGRTWARAGGEMPEDPGPVDPPGRTRARIIDGRPRHARAYRLYQLMATLAGESLYITMAYPLVPITLRRALTAAVGEGVDVRLLVPSSSDVPVLNQAARAHYTALLRHGVRIYEWKGPMLHAKTAVADGSLSLVGSTNLNPFSLLGNYELDVEIQDPAFGQALQEQFMADIEQAREIMLPEWKARPLSRRIRERLSAGVLWLPARVYSD